MLSIWIHVQVVCLQFLVIVVVAGEGHGAIMKVAISERIEELCLADLTIIIDISLSDHLIDFLVGKRLSGIDHGVIERVIELSSGDKTVAIFIEDLEANVLICNQEKVTLKRRRRVADTNIHSLPGKLTPYLSDIVNVVAKGHEIQTLILYLTAYRRLVIALQPP